MTREAIAIKKIAPPAGPFSAAIRSGDFIFLSGQVAQDAKTGKLIEGDVGAQTEQIFANLSAVLEAAGKTLEDVVRVGVYLTDMGSFSAMNDVPLPILLVTEPYSGRITGHQPLTVQKRGSRRSGCA
jgi:2-iminobutanoate/2-iminopropanoate deaminase